MRWRGRSPWPISRGALQRGAVAPELLSKARHAVAACKAGVQRVHVINGLVDEGLLAEVFSNEGIGTLVYASEYQQIRRARKKDVRTIQALIRTSVESEEIVRRTQAADREADRRLLHLRDRPQPGGVRGPARLPGAAHG